MTDTKHMQPIGWWYQDSTGCIHMSMDMALGRLHELETGHTLNLLYGSPLPSEPFTPSPSSHVAVLDAAAQSLLAAQNNVIDGLMAENEKLRKALEPFSEVAGRFDDMPVSAILPQQCWFTPHSLREARAALATTEGSDNGD